MKTLRVYSLIVCVGLAMVAALADEAAGTTLPKPAATDVVQQVAKDAQADWTDFQYRATGIGVAPAATSEAQRAGLAREMAIALAESNLLEAVLGVHITSDTTVKIMADKSEVHDLIMKEIHGLLQGAIVIHEKELDNGAYRVEMAIPMLGDNSIAKAIELPKLVVKCEPQKEVTVDEVPAPAAVDGTYTGLLIDCRGKKLHPALSPFILDERDEAVYPRKDVSSETVLQKGVVAYYKSLDAAKADGRVGAHPLIIKASDVKKDADNKWYISPKVTQADTARILAEDVKAKFLDAEAVGFLVD